MTTKSKHTPGPWTAGHAVSGEWHVFSKKLAVGARSAPIVRNVRNGIAEGGPAEIESNAYLIAAAPDLLAVAEQVLAMLEADDDRDIEAGREPYQDKPLQCPTHLLRLLRAAIAKAEGK